MAGISSGQIMAIGLSVYVLSAILPGAITNFFGANTTTWDAGTAALWGIIPLAIVAFFALRYGGSGSKGAT